MRDDEQRLLIYSSDEPIGRNPLRAVIEMTEKTEKEQKNDQSNNQNNGDLAADIIEKRNRWTLLGFAWGQFILTVIIVILAVARIESSWDPNAMEYVENAATRNCGYAALGLALFSSALLIGEWLWKRHESGIVCIVKALLTLLHVPVWSYPGNLWWLFFSFLRFVIPFRDLSTLHFDVYKNRNSIPRLFKMFEVTFPKFDSLMMVRLLANNYAFFFFGAIMIILLVIMAYLFYASERKANSGFSFARSLYWAAITSSGVGYGDVTPTKNNTFSMILACIMVLSGVVLVAMIIGLIINQMRLSPSEQSVIEIANSLRMKEERERSAARVILKLLELCEYERNMPNRRSHDHTSRITHRDLVDACYRFEKVDWKYNNTHSHDISTNTDDVTLQLKEISDEHEVYTTKVKESIENTLKNMRYFNENYLNYQPGPALKNV